MKQRGKTVEVFSKDLLEFNFSAASEIPCNKHPSSSSVGICPNCLKERLLKLVCTECGEQRLSSSCSCSDDVSSSSYRNSCSALEIGSVGRVSFLIGNNKNEPEPQQSDFVLRRSSSSSVEMSKNRGFWRIKSLFMRKGIEKDGKLFDQRSEIWVSDNPTCVSRSRSLCSYRGDDDNGFSSRKISDVRTNQCLLFHDESSEPRRRSGFRGVFGGKRGGPRNSMELDESGFIDLKLDLLLSDPKQGGSSDHGFLGNGNGNEIRGLKRDSRRHKAWKWIFKCHYANKEEKERSSSIHGS